MTVYTKGTWAGGCVHTIVPDHDGTEPSGTTIGEWLHKLPYNEFCDALQSMIDDGYIDKDKADNTYNAYADNNDNKEV